MAYEHLRASLTKGNLWLYLLTSLEDGPSPPIRLKAAVKREHGFEPATITFYSVLYKLGREGLVKKSTNSFRSPYEITPRGREQLSRARDLLAAVASELST
jgi:DNA-binding PadR family transcriptional regulator